MIGDYPAAVQDAVMDSLQTHSELASQFLQNEAIRDGFTRLLLDLILSAETNTSQSI